jgi:hypothetical protein
MCGIFTFPFFKKNHAHQIKYKNYQTQQLSSEIFLNIKTMNKTKEIAFKGEKSQFKKD